LLAELERAGEGVHDNGHLVVFRPAP
jgi:hypothetical protein